MGDDKSGWQSWHFLQNSTCFSFRFPLPKTLYVPCPFLPYTIHAVHMSTTLGLLKLSQICGVAPNISFLHSQLATWSIPKTCVPNKCVLNTRIEMWSTVYLLGVLNCCLAWNISDQGRHMAMLKLVHLKMSLLTKFRTL